MDLATDQGPYFQLMARMAESLAPVKNQEKVPEWIDLIYRIRDTRIQAKTLDAQGIAKAGIIKRTTDKVASKLNRLESQTGVETTDALSFEARMEAAKAYKQYQDALQALSAVADSRKTAFKVASDLYSEDPATGESPFFMARQGEKKLRMVLGKKNKQTDLFWDLINGPIQFYHAYVIREAQCQLQSIWEKEVFLEVQYVSSGMDLNKLLMGNDGYAIKFVKGPAAPFIDRSRGKGYHARSIEGRSVGFQNRFPDVS